MRRVGRWRIDRGHSAEKFAELIGVSLYDLGRIECGGCDVSDVDARALQICFGEYPILKDLLTTKHAGEYENAMLIRLDSSWARGAGSWT